MDHIEKIEALWLRLQPRRPLDLVMCLALTLALSLLLAKSIDWFKVGDRCTKTHGCLLASCVGLMGGRIVLSSRMARGRLSNLLGGIRGLRGF